MENNGILSQNQRYKKFSALKTVYMVLFLFVLMGRFISLYWIIPHIVDTVAFVGFTCFAAAFVIFDLIGKRRTLSVPNIVFLVLFFVSCFISCVIYVKYGWADNLKSLMSIALSLFFLYPYSFVNGAKELEKIIVLVQKITIISWMIFSLVSIYTFIIQYSKIFYIHGTRILLGCIENRLFGVFSDPNYASVISIITMAFSVAVLNYKNQNKFIKIIAALNIGVQFVYLVLGASRTGEVCFLMVLFISAFVYSYKINSKKNFFVLIVRLIIIACACFAVHFIIDYTRVIFSYIPSLFSSTHSSGSGAMTGLYQVSMERPDVVENSDISNLRFRIWGSAIDIFKTTWLFGASPRNALKYAKDVLPNAFIAQRGYDAHNFYVATVFYTGVLGSLFLGIFLIKRAYKIVKYYLVNNFKVNNPLFNSLVISLICTAVSGMFLSEILFITTVGSFFFWTFLGYVTDVISKSRNSCEDR